MARRRIFCFVYRRSRTSPEHNTAKTIAWHRPEPRELYTPDAVRRLDQLMSQARGMLPVVGEAEGRRLQVQLDLWDKAKDVIATGELID